jgi:hypothetical protein
MGDVEGRIGSSNQLRDRISLPRRNRNEGGRPAGLRDLPKASHGRPRGTRDSRRREVRQSSTLQFYTRARILGLN